MITELEDPSRSRRWSGGKTGIVLISLLVTKLLSMKQSEEPESNKKLTEGIEESGSKIVAERLRESGSERADALSRTSLDARMSSSQSSLRAEG